MIVRVAMHIGVYGHDAVDDRLVRRRADDDLQGLQGERSLLGAGVVEEVANRAARPHE